MYINIKQSLILISLTTQQQFTGDDGVFLQYTLIVLAESKKDPMFQFPSLVQFLFSLLNIISLTLRYSLKRIKLSFPS